MRAAVLEAFGQPLVVKQVPTPELGTGEVIVDVVATRVLAYAKDVLSGERGYVLKLPVIPGPGAIGRVRRTGPDATRLAVGDWVYCDPTVRSRDDALSPDITLQGLSARDEGGSRLQEYYGNGAWAEQVRVPTENAVPIGPIAEADAAAWCWLGTCLVPYGGLAQGGLKAGETVLVSGATGNFGRAAVAVALAMGAGCVIATGRNRQVLQTLEEQFGSRVRGVALSGTEEDDHAAILRAAPGPIDLVFDILPPMASSEQARAAIMTVRPYGRVVLMGGINMMGGDPLQLRYNWIMRNCITIHGVWMYPRDAPQALASMIRSGQLQIGGQEMDVFGLDQVNEAVANAAERRESGAFRTTILKPGAG